jgi:hypothetical protein
MANFLDLDEYAKLVLGKRVDRATSALPATTQTPMFTISGGKILLTAIYGVVTTVIQTQACNLNLVSNPTTGTDDALCAVLDISADEAGTIYSISGLVSDALWGVSAGLGQGLERQLILPVGTIDALTSATNTGAIQWSMWYVPLDTGASVVVA